ncbi:MAG TPA: hypothetical protein PKV98_01765 [Burkholderiaceae bacterium]|nr:hypothetical protein [Burkholderiaceae bacterium]
MITARSNYFRVKDPIAFAAALEGSGNKVAMHPKAEGYVCITADGGFALDWMDEALNEPRLEDIILEHIAAEHVAILMEAGGGRGRSVQGWATALAWDGRRVDIGLDSIYDLIYRELGLSSQYFSRVAGDDLPDLYADGYSF